MFGLTGEFLFELFKGCESGGVLWKFAGEGIERAFGGVALSNSKTFRLDVKRAFGAILFLGTEKEGGVFREVLDFDAAAGDLAKGFLAESGEDGFGDVAGVASDKSENGVSFLGSEIETTSPAIFRVNTEKFIDVLARDRRCFPCLKLFIDDFDIVARAKQVGDIFLLFR